MFSKRKEFNKRGIFLLFEGLPPTIFESQVISHVRQLNDCGYSIDIWAFSITSETYLNANRVIDELKAKYEVEIRSIRGVRFGIPFSSCLNSLLLLLHFYLNGRRPSFIHARTEYSAFIASRIKSILDFKLIWDARGDSLSEYSVIIKGARLSTRLLSPLRIRMIKHRLKSVSKCCDKAIFVSDALRECQAPNMSSESYMILPCLADESKFYYDPNLRAQIRARLDYGNSDIVLVYVGSSAPWQCVPETLSMMASVLSGNEKFKALIVTSNPEFFLSLIPMGLNSRFNVLSASLSEVGGILNAADIAFMLREENTINWVASPVKFAEYSMTGLHVVTGKAIKQVNEYGAFIGNIVDPDEVLGLNEDDVLLMSAHREEVSKAAISVFSRKNATEKLIDFYSF
ncbi:hypothetical protein [Marinobacterium aestuariivivens]|uniref:Glycosyltransferase subfamily 4-like N-terminal domain-containing protein n=1 Tax=Marinobacterium aestuariivivens TaxID=1698799 RepID=A0ABW1ZWZ6_9GAMM